MSLLSGRRLLLGVTGGIAAYKAPQLVRRLKAEGALVRVVLTRGAEAFVTPVSLEAVSGEKVFRQEDFLLPQGGHIPHIELGDFAELILVAPATASFLASLRLGEASSLLVATIMASQAKVVIFPAMNERMWRHQATQENVRVLRSFGYEVVSPASGSLVCGEVGPGRLPEEEVILSYARRALSPQDLSGKTVLITCGPTREPIDLVRFLSNRSSGRMGLALAQAAFERGAHVILIHGPLSRTIPPLFETIPVERAEEMRATVLDHLEEADLIIMAAAVSDFSPVKVFAHKIKKQEKLVLELVQTPDILSEIAKKRRPGQLIVGFAAEEKESLETEAQRKLQEKGVDLLVANPIDQPGVGFETETNEVLILTKSGEKKSLPRSPKTELAHKILDEVVNWWSTVRD